MVLLLALELTPLLVGLLPDEPGEDTLRFYLSKADRVAVATIMSRPIPVPGSLGVTDVLCTADLGEVLKGDLRPKKNLSIRIRLLGEPDRRLACLQKGAKCILFLKRPNQGSSTWETADPWFGVQPDNTLMVRTLRRLADEDD